MAHYLGLLDVMPVLWREQLHQAATCVDGEQIVELIDQIPPEHASLTVALTEMVQSLSLGSNCGVKST